MTTAFDIGQAVIFLSNVLYVSQNEMLDESTNPDTHNHYISSGNSLAVSALMNYDREKAMTILTKMDNLQSQYNKQVKTYWKPTFHPLVVAKLSITYEERTTNEDIWIANLNGYKVSSNNSSSGIVDIVTENKSNILMLYSLENIQQFYKTGNSSYYNTARSAWQKALTLWNGYAFNDSVAKSNGYFETYKTALGLICSKYPELKEIGEVVLPANFWDGGLQNATNGGVYFRYIIDENNVPVKTGGTYENIESTSSFIIAFTKIMAY